MRQSGSFEGWYFKQQTRRGAIAFIPARHIDAQGNMSACIQVVTDTASARAQFPYEAFDVRRKGLCVTVGANRFSLQGIAVDIDADGLSVQGELAYRAIKPPCYDIMGPFALLPMQCRHSVVSLRHAVSGTLRVNGQEMRFANDPGYIEGDSGSSFPSRYVWTHCCTKGSEPASLMLSVAHIPFAGLKFTGVIGFIYMHGREYRIATYLGAVCTQISDTEITVQQGKWLLRVRLLQAQPIPLHAPVHGGMTRIIRESAACRVRYTLLEHGRPLLDFTSDQAGFECEWQEGILTNS